MDTISYLRRHGLFDARVPRFTSFPPANRFTAAVGVDRAVEWFAAIPDGADLSLYVHIPFCRRLCWFCACRTQGTRTDAPLERYVESVIAEIRHVRSLLPSSLRVARLHFGGGTPTILPVRLMTRLLEALDGAFGLSEMSEFSVEIDPMEIDRERLAVLGAYGLSRASLGVQDFDPAVQRAIGRAQTAEATREAVALLDAIGVAAINFDLLYGLPCQTRESMARTLAMVMALGPSRLALYGYAHVPWASKRQVMISDAALPAPEERFALFEMARRQLLGSGFRQIGIDHFAHPGDALTRAMDARRLARNFQGYTDDRIAHLIGLGASSISRLPQGYLQNQASTAIYQGLVDMGRGATARGFEFSVADRARADIIEQLMCYQMVDLKMLSSSHEEAESWLRELEQDFPDVLEFDEDVLRLHPSARPLVRIMASRIAESEEGENLYSTAV